ncbi:MAG: hypothetical protein ACXVFV_03070 [Mycobacteriales bacterium]
MKRLLPALGALVLVSACGSSGSAASSAAATQVTTTPTPTASACPAVSKAAFRWPAGVPSDLPQPPAATYTGTSTTKDGLTLVRFTTAASLRDGVLFVVREVQKAGFTLGRGDAEPAEADAPFGRGEVRGIYKMLVRGQCTTEWLVAVTKALPNGGSPILPTASRGPSSAPLPFG